MKLIFPNNIFSTFFILSLDDKYKKDIIIREASLLTQELMVNNNAVALIPSLDLVNQRELKVSAKYCISFKGLLSNSYVYFNNKNADIDKVYLKGDISANDVIVSKIVFQERYNIRPQFILNTENAGDDGDFIISGNENWNENKFRSGTSISEQLSDIIEYPYVNYLFVSKEESTMLEFHALAEGIVKRIDEEYENHLEKMGLGREIDTFIKENINSITYSLSEHQEDAVNELYQMVYFYGILEDLFDIKFIE